MLLLKQSFLYDSVLAREYDRVAHMEEYKGLDEKKLHDIAYDETIAEMSEMMLTDTDAIGRIAGKLKNQDKGLWEKIKDFFTGLVEKLRNAYQDAEPDSEIAKILKRAIKDNEALAEAWASAVVEAGENYQLQDGQKKNAREGVRFSERYLKAPENQEVAALADKVVSGNFSGNDRVYLGSISDSNAKRIQELTGIDVTGFRVAIEARQIEHILKGHGTNGDTDHTMADLKHVAKIEYTLNNPDSIILSGTTRAYVSNVNGKNKPAKTVLYEKNIGEKSYYAVQAVADTKAKTLYVVSAFIGEQGYKKGTPQFTNAISPGATSENAAVDVPTNSVPQQGAEVKGNVRYSSRNNRDAEYMELAKDPEKNRGRLQKMVEDAAKEAGYTEVAYHGTNADFTVFDKGTIGNNYGAVSDLGFYFTPYYEDARGFSTNFGKEGSHVLKGALRFTNPLVVEDTGWGSAIEQTDVRHGDLLRWAREGKNDGIIVRSLDEEFLDDDGSYDTVYVAFDSNQFKVLDPVTYDDSGNVIPLSKRFDTANEDIRYSSRNTRNSKGNQTETENFKKWFGDWQNDPARASKVVNEDGTPKVVYHQTAEDFTVFEPRHQGAGTRDSDTPFGIFMKSSDKNIGLNGEKQMALYAKIVNPLTVIDRADLIYQLKMISPEYVKAAVELRELNDAYQKKYDDATKAFQDYIVEWRKAHPVLPFRKNLTNFYFSLDKSSFPLYNTQAFGRDAAIAQSVERILGKDEVASSNLASSSKNVRPIGWAF